MSYAPFKKRVYAFLLDYLIIIVYGIFIVGMLSVVFRSYIEPLFSSSPVVAELTGFLMITLPVSLYFILCERSKSKGTIGKRQMNIQVVDDAGHRIGLGQSIVRNIIKFLPWETAHFGIWQLMLPSHISETPILIILTAVNLTLIAYLITPIMQEQKKNIYDWAACTVVIQIAK